MAPRGGTCWRLSSGGLLLVPGSQLLANIGTWSQSLAQAWLVLDLTHSSVALGTITMLQRLPLLVLALVGGRVADRLAKRQLLVVTQVALTVQALTLGVLVGAPMVTIFEVGLLALLLGLTNAPNNPAQQAFISELVGRELSAVKLSCRRAYTLMCRSGRAGDQSFAPPFGLTWSFSR